MGEGKTTYMIENIINANPDKRYICVVPTVEDKVDKKTGAITYESEATRYKRLINGVVLEPEPIPQKIGGKYKGKPTKLQGLRNAIARGENIVTSHALIQMIDQETMNLIKDSDYNLIIDESLNVVCTFDDIKRNYNINRDDIMSLIQDQWLRVGEKGLLIWNHEKEQAQYKSNYTGHWAYIKNLCCLESLTTYCDIRPEHFKKGKAKEPPIILVWNMPIGFFKLFDTTYIATYLWEGSNQKAYFDAYEIEYEHLMLINKQLMPYDKNKELSLRVKAYNLMNICENKKLNEIGTKKGKEMPLSKSWFPRKEKN